MYLFNDLPAILRGGVLSVDGKVIAIGVAPGYPGLVWEDAPPVDPPPPPVPGTIPPRLVASAFGVTPLPNDYDIALEGPFNLIAALYWDIGTYWLLFAEEQPDANYHVIISDGGSHIEATEKTTGYVAISATDAASSPVDPAVFNIEVYRL